MANKPPVKNTMQTPQRITRRNNKIIFITSGLIGLAIILTLFSSRKIDHLTIRVGDNSLQLANQLQSYKEMVEILPDHFIVHYIPTTPWNAVNFRRQSSHYKIFFSDGKITKIIWQEDTGHLLAPNLTHITIALKR